jgi:hypothetical protein
MPTPTILSVTIDGGSVQSGVVTQTAGGEQIAASYSQFIAFGDSNIDSGYFLTHTISNNTAKQTLYTEAVASGGGLPTTIGSEMNSQLLAGDIGQTAIPVGETGGTNYAASGATITGALSGSLAPSVVSQINTYLASTDDVANSTALYLLSGGGNDVKEAQALYTSSDPTETQDQINYMISEANSFAAAIEQLHSDGAQYILIDDRTGGGVLGATFNNTLWADLNNAGTPFLVSDDNAVVEGIAKATSAANTAYGIDVTNTIKPPAGPFSQSGDSSDPTYSSTNGGAVVNPDPGLLANSWSLYGTTADQQPNAATQYLWADDEHLAGAGQTAEAEYMDNLIKTGVPTVSETLTANPYLTTGLTTGGTTSAATYQWQEEALGGTWQNINGATGSTYTIQNSDIGSELRVEAFDGAISSVSASTEPVAPCYCRGTLIRTDRGEVPVEDLAIGDKIVTKAGTAQPIKWMGRRSYAGRFIMGRTDILPICIKAGALDDDVPRRDLWISTHHALFLEDVLIEAKDLVNGVSIVQAERVKNVDYFHVELDAHDVIFAEGAPSESFLDDDSRAMFHNAHEFDALYPDAQIGKKYCAPRLEDGYEVAVASQRIAARAGLLRCADPPRIGPLRGYIDLVSSCSIVGWAQNADNIETPVCLDIYADGQLIGQTLANSYREDLKLAGLGSGRHGFLFTPPARLASVPQAVEVRRSLDGAALEFSTQAQRASG